MAQVARKPLVLVVDEHRDTREMYRIVLDVAGYRAAEAASVEEGLRTASLLRPRAVVCDWRLPDGDALALARGLRGQPGGGRIALVAIAGAMLGERRTARALRSGFDRVIEKPVLPDAVVATIEHVLHVRELRALRTAAVRIQRQAASLLRHASAVAPGTGHGPQLAVEIAARVSDRLPSGTAFVIADDEGRYLAVSGALASLAGYSPDALAGLSVWDLTPVPDEAAGRILWNTFIAAGAQEGDYVLRTRDGSLIEARYSAIANIAPGLHVSVITPVAVSRPCIFVS